MRPDEVAELLAYIIDSVPNGKYGQRAVEGFYDGLHDLPTPDVVAATKAVIRRSPYKPSVADIRDETYRRMGLGDGDSQWEIILQTVKGSPPWPVLDNPIAQAALASIGGFPMVRMTEHPAIVRKDFLEAYERYRGRELGEPVMVKALLAARRHEVGRGATAGELAGTARAIEAGGNVTPSPEE